MVIVTRYKSSNGNVIGYDVNTGSSIEYIKAEDMYRLDAYITNAYKLKNGEYIY